jgi:hypothetical protein
MASPCGPDEYAASRVSEREGLAEAARGGRDAILAIQSWYLIENKGTLRKVLPLKLISC